VVSVDVAAPGGAPGVRHHALDLAEPGADGRLAKLLRAERVSALCHLAFFTNPRDAGRAHELESIGTRAVLAGAASARIPRVVVRSFTAVYGARGQNPGLLTERSALQASSALAWVRDKLEAEEHAAAFGRRYPKTRIAVLRMAPLFGPGLDTFYTRLFDRRVVPTLMGFDPLVQLLHPDDALRALESALASRAVGAFNVVPKGPIALATALHLAEKIPVPVPHPLAYAASDALYRLGLVEAPGAFLDYARYPCVADGARASSELGFVAAFTSHDALRDYLRHRHPGGAGAFAEAS
jgi:UDP-glucose 4-epimerase